jgi:hypothetical protein
MKNKISNPEFYLWHFKYIYSDSIYIIREIIADTYLEALEKAVNKRFYLR